MMFAIVLLLISCYMAILPLIDTEALEQNLSHPDRLVFYNKCYTSLDNECFYNGPPYFDPDKRPKSVVPQEANNVKFLLFTPKNVKKEFKLKSDMDSIKQSPYNCNFETKILTHGFKSSPDEFIEMKDAMLGAVSINVIICNWQHYSGEPYYQAAANTRTAAARLAKLMSLLMDFCGIDGSKFHLIGFSLGAHVMGYVGKRIPNIKRITGLDPSWVGFQGMDKEIHLNSDDADFVDIIHTNGGGDGLERLDTEMLESARCSHHRSIKLFTASIKNDDCKFIAVECGNVKDFQDGKCRPENRKNNTVGFYSKKNPGMPPKTSFVFRTDGEFPFCVPDSNNPARKTEHTTEATTSSSISGLSWL